MQQSLCMHNRTAKVAPLIREGHDELYAVLLGILDGEVEALETVGAFVDGAGGLVIGARKQISQVGTAPELCSVSTSSTQVSTHLVVGHVIGRDRGDHGEGPSAKNTDADRRKKGKGGVVLGLEDELGHPVCIHACKAVLFAIERKLGARGLDKAGGDGAGGWRRGSRGRLSG